MKQSKLGALIETLINTTIGYVVAIISQILVFPLFDIHVALSTNLGIGAWFTLISIIRSYIIRRWFDRLIHSTAMRWAKEESN